MKTVKTYWRKIRKGENVSGMLTQGEFVCCVKEGCKAGDLIEVEIPSHAVVSFVDKMPGTFVSIQDMP